MVQQEIDDDMDHLYESDDVRILLVGDPGVGKTSLIYCLVNDEFDPHVPAKMADISIPPEVAPENVSLCIADYSEREQDQSELEEAIREANVICIVYTASDEVSLDRVAKFWIPTVRKSQMDFSKTHKPIILVASKVDLVTEEKSFDKVSAVIQEFVDIEAFIEVSALTQKNVVELFVSAQKAVNYPLAPLFDPQSRVLTEKCQIALIDIFKQCDHDGDQLLSDHELNLFQENCFGTPLQRDALDDMKSIIKQSTIDGIVDNGMTQAGFLFLHTLSIDKGRHDFTWQVLRKFHYDKKINLKKDEIDLLDQQSGDLIDRDSFSSDSQVDNRIHYKPSSEMSEQDNENHNHLDLTWVREHSKIIKTSIGLTLAALISMLAFKYLVRGSSKSSV